MKHMPRSRCGQTLVEMIVVIGVVILLVTGVISSTTVSLSTTKQTQSKGLALQFAQEGIELSRSKRDAGWDTFADLSVNNAETAYCVGDDKEFVVSGTVCLENIQVRDSGESFIRTVTFTLLSPDDPTEKKMLVDSTVTWGEGVLEGNSVKLKTYLTQWR